MKLKFRADKDDLIIFGVLVRRVSVSINSFQNGLLGFFKYLNKETKNAELLDDSSKDEFGVMSTVINKNIIKTK